MLTLEDCIAFSELSEEEILAIAEHENLPEAVAAELGNYLVHQPGGERRIKRMIVGDIKAARARGDHRHAGVLKSVLRHFVQEHGAAKGS